MRKGEILNLTWDRIDLKSRMIRLKAEDVKEKLPKKIPISCTLKLVLDALPRSIHDHHVFLFKGKPVSDIRTALKAGCDAARVPYGRDTENGFTFHDLRHTFQVNARRAGVDKNVRMVIMGHSDGNDMNLHYDTVDETDLIDAIDRIERYVDQLFTKTENVDQSVDQGTQAKKQVNKKVI